jgi:hypothetical protein
MMIRPSGILLIPPFQAEDTWAAVRSMPTIISRLVLVSPERESAQLIHAVDDYLDGKPTELIERCNIPRQPVKDALALYQTRIGRLRALNRLLDEMGIPK